MANFGEKSARFVGTALGGAIVLLLVLLNLKGCVLTPWMPPAEETLYGIEGGDGRDLFLVLYPDHEVLFVYMQDMPSYAEAVKATWRGTYGTRYVSRLWKLEGPGVGLLGYRVYPAKSKPVHMESRVLQRNALGTSSSVFPKVGDTSYLVVLFSEDALRFEGMWLQRYDSPEGFVEILESLLVEGAE